jgi:hypothetical protein
LFNEARLDYCDDHIPNLNDGNVSEPEETGRGETNWPFMIINPKWRSSSRIDCSDLQTRPTNRCRLGPTTAIAIAAGRSNKSHRLIALPKMTGEDCVGQRNAFFTDIQLS